jgi:hypothetical protein
MLGICHMTNNFTPFGYSEFILLALTFTQFTVPQLLPSAVSQLLLLLPFTLANARLQLTGYSLSLTNTPVM